MIQSIISKTICQVTGCAEQATKLWKITFPVAKNEEQYNLTIPLCDFHCEKYNSGTWLNEESPIEETYAVDDMGRKKQLVDSIKNKEEIIKKLHDQMESFQAELDKINSELVPLYSELVPILIKIGSDSKPERNY